MSVAPQPPVPVPDAWRCPLCGQGNGCAMAAGRQAADCWCMATPVAPAALARVPPAQRNLACICERCAQG